jgi:hypothetical protein
LNLRDLAAPDFLEVENNMQNHIEKSKGSNDWTRDAEIQHA